MYNFYFFVTLNTIISAFLTYLKQDILKYVSISEEMLITQITLFSLFVGYYVFVENGDVNKTLAVLRENKNNILVKIAIFDVLLMFAIIISGKILMNEKIIYSKPIKIGLYLIFITLISRVYEQTHNIYIYLGIFVMLFGLILIEYGKSN